VTTTTISRQQHELARERVAQAGFQDRITLLLEDYRDLEGEYDKLVSIEMIEAVGQKYYETYFAQCGRLLNHAGLMLLQAITITDQRHDAARWSVDFIQRHIFPGSTIPPVTSTCCSPSPATEGKDIKCPALSTGRCNTLRFRKMGESCSTMVWHRRSVVARPGRWRSAWAARCVARKRKQQRSPQRIAGWLERTFGLA
jgi:cyclopropane-fatty-acyl-phospholipid synthase